MRRRKTDMAAGTRRTYSIRDIPASVWVLGFVSMLMDVSFQQAIEQAGTAFAGGKSLRMPSGAGHDAQILATVMPAGMLFVPSIGGISHHWTENTADADIVTGAEVFVEACRRLLAR